MAGVSCTGVIKVRNFDGRTVKDLEYYFKKRNSYNKPIIICMGVILALMLIIGYLAKEISILKTANNDLQLQINTIKEKNQSLMLKLDSQPLQKETSSEYLHYKIKPKDSLAKISLFFYDTEVYATGLADLNGLKTDSVLQIGQTIKLPKTPLKSWNIED